MPRGSSGSTGAARALVVILDARGSSGWSKRLVGLLGPPRATASYRKCGQARNDQVIGATEPWSPHTKGRRRVGRGRRNGLVIPRMDDGEDRKGERGGDTGETKQLGHGKQAEKGDQRREKMGKSSGPTHTSEDRRAQGQKDRTAGGD